MPFITLCIDDGFYTDLVQITLIIAIRYVHLEIQGAILVNLKNAKN